MISSPMTHETLYLDHWPPTDRDVADAFARVEAKNQRVEVVVLRRTECPGETLNETGDYAWGAMRVDPAEGELPEYGWIAGGVEAGNGHRVTLSGPAAGPALAPFHRQEPPPPTPPPPVPSGGELGVLDRLAALTDEEEFVVTPREFAGLRKFARNQMDFSIDAGELKRGMMGYVEWKDAAGGAHRARVVNSVARARGLI